MTYPNLLVLDYLNRTGKANPEVMLTAESYVNLGYQRQVTFEVPGGGFDWFGRPPGKNILSAYGLMLFTDMTRVWDVDPALLQRTTDFLVQRQQPDGSWEMDAGVSTWRGVSGQVPVTAFVTWALAEGGQGAAAEQAVRRGLAWLNNQLDDVRDDYFLALTANAFVAGQPEAPVTRRLLQALAGSAQRDDTAAWWETEHQTMTFSSGKNGSVETTALAAYAFLKAGVEPALANQALTYLIRAKDSFGTWGSTQATTLSLRALLASLGATVETNRGTVTVLLNGEEVETLTFDEENSDVVQILDLGPRTRLGENVVELRTEGEVDALYQVIGRYYLPWDLVKDEPREEPPLRIDVRYDQTELATHDLLRQTVRAELLKGGSAQMVMLDLGIPPGFQVQADDLAEAVGSGLIERFEITGRQVILYLEGLRQGEPVEIRYRLRARYPVRVQAPRSAVYEYYNPENRAETPPTVLTVR